MAVPGIWDRTAGSITTAADPWTSLAGPGRTGGMLLIMVIRASGATVASTPLGADAVAWTPILVNYAADASDDSVSVYCRTATGSGDVPTTIDMSASCKGYCYIMSITGAADPAVELPYLATAIGTGANPDPPALTPSGGANDYLWLVFATADGEQTAFTAPSGFTFTSFYSSGTGGAAATNCVLGFCAQDTGVNRTTINPAAVTLAAANAGWTAITMAVAPPAEPKTPISGTDASSAGADSASVDFYRYLQFDTGVGSDGISYALSVSADAGAGTDASILTTRISGADGDIYDFSEYALDEVWTSPSVHGRMEVPPLFAGCWYQTVDDGSRCIELIPAAAATTPETYAGLVKTVKNYGNHEFTIRYKTLAQTRTSGTPNPWEVAWVMFRYVDDDHFYWFLHKTDGWWEIGRGDPAYGGGQRFLASGYMGFAHALNTWYTLRVKVVGPVITVWLDGAFVGTATDTNDGIGLDPSAFASGAICGYPEDAKAHYDDIIVSAAVATENGGVTVPVSGTDSGASSDTATAPTASDSKADLGSGSEVTTLSRPAADSGAGSDASVIAYQLSGTDSGTGSDSGSQAVTSTVLGQWFLNESPAIHGTTIVDSSGAGNNGTLSTSDGSTNKAVTGKIGGAIAFDGVNDRVNVNNTIFNSIGAGDFTLTGWIYNTNQTHRSCIFGKDDQAVPGRTLFFILNSDIAGAISAGKLVIALFSSDTVYYALETAAGAISANAWHHIVHRRQSGVHTVWVDGVSISITPSGAGTAGMTIQSTASLFQIGARTWAGFEDYFEGNLDHIAVYARALSDTEIADEFAAGGVTKSGSDTSTSNDASITSASYLQSETGAGTETSRVSQSVADAGAGSETGAFTTPLSGSDTGTDTETVILAESSTQSDTGTGSETGVLAAVIPPVSDVGIGPDSSILVAKYTLTETGTGADASILVAQYAQSDGGNGVDASSLAAVFSLADTSSGTDSGSTGAPISGTDTGTSSEVAGVRIAFADTGTGSESSVISLTASDAGTVTETPSVQLISSDTGTGVDVISAFTRAVADSGSGTDDNILSAGNAKQGSDSGTSSDTSTLTAVFTQSDTGTDTEATVIQTSVLDTGAGIDITSLAKTVIDSGSGSDLGVLEIAGQTKSGTDSGFSSDSSVLAITIAVSETGTGVDASIIQKVFTGTDEGTGTEAITASRVVGDFGGATETGSFTSVDSLLVAEVGTGSDTANISIRSFLSDVDFGIGTENATLNISFAEPEYHHSVLIQASGYTSETISTVRRKPQMVTANGGRSKMSKAQ